MFVTHAAVDQQDGHVDNVEIWKNVGETTGGAVGQGAHQVAGVVEVARHSPETRGQELTAVVAAVSGHIGALNVGGLAAPDGAGPLCTAEQILLMVGGAEYVVTNEAEQQDGKGMSV